MERLTIHETLGGLINATTTAEGSGIDISSKTGTTILTEAKATDGANGEAASLTTTITNPFASSSKLLLTVQGVNDAPAHH